VTEAIYSDGVLKPVTPLALPNDQRVQVIVRAVPGLSAPNRAELMRQLFEDMDQMEFFLEVPLPPRETLHDRGL